MAVIKYVGPHRGGLQQIGSTPIAVTWGEHIELPDDVVETLLEQAPDHWELPKKSTPKKAAEADTEENN